MLNLTSQCSWIVSTLWDRMEKADFNKTKLNVTKLCLLNESETDYRKDQNVHLIEEKCMIAASCCSNVIFIVAPPMGEIASDYKSLFSVPVCAAFPN